jgi:hypothetical protein
MPGQLIREGLRRFPVRKSPLLQRVEKSPLCVCHPWWLCEFFWGLADPSPIPWAIFLEVATSFAGTRGLSPHAIAEGAFWRSSSVLVVRYLLVVPIINGVALVPLGRLPVLRSLSNHDL